MRPPRYQSCCIAPAERRVSKVDLWTMLNSIDSGTSDEELARAFGMFFGDRSVDATYGAESEGGARGWAF